MKFINFLLAITSVLSQLDTDKLDHENMFIGLGWPQDIAKYAERIVAQWVLDNPDKLPSDSSKIQEYLDSLYNTPDAPCNAKYWSLKLKDTTRGDGESSTYTGNAKTVEVKRKSFLGTCQILTKDFNPNRLVFYFKDDKCKEFDKAECN
ncbi:hypothetical protein CONCODRAFT_73587 [Conidiobolus coronatus NRRL 28638]|uniref:Uncharacterized protein n=1 Tax=Conidiobolus coronatus (strain ATCC 28846 / CBS 209.66 / NRRL 28638) TaxID=796925 RepID=A0A137NV19_CONC2|nr:hypothetical protein CONCODRAFT_73587 [Conidiobolus coronatus NRRL 28638]|eukprot:KXN66582.1 hypothetical protein CONCODRAFT_73587 [Conidiobolus coronatus NRRL 28638]